MKSEQEDYKAVKRAKFSIIHRILEYLSETEDLEDKIIGYAIWKIVLQDMKPEYNNEQRKKIALEKCQKEINKWFPKN